MNSVGRLCCSSLMSGTVDDQRSDDRSFRSLNEVVEGMRCENTERADRVHNVQDVRSGRRLI